MSGQKKIVVFGNEALARSLDAMPVESAAPATINLAVIPVAFETLSIPAQLEGMSERQWQTLAEEPLLQARRAIQAASSLLRAPGGALVLIVPETGMRGTAQFTAQSMAMEGARALAKSVARAWASRQITVNSIAVAASQISGAKDEKARPSLEKVAQLALTLADEKACVTGTTLFADGGDMTSI